VPLLVYLLAWYKSAKTDAEAAEKDAAELLYCVAHAVGYLNLYAANLYTAN
jgi:hypothetical protein